MDSRDGLLHGGDLGPALVPGDPEKSLLIKAVRHTIPTSKCPRRRGNYPTVRSPILPNGSGPEPGRPTDDAAAPSRVAKASAQVSDDDRAWWWFQPIRR